MEEMLVTAEGLKLLPLRKCQIIVMSIGLVMLARNWVSQHGGHVPNYAVPIFLTWDCFKVMRVLCGLSIIRRSGIRKSGM
jgi:hypothetical protein